MKKSLYINISLLALVISLSYYLNQIFRQYRVLVGVVSIKTSDKLMNVLIMKDRAWLLILLIVILLIINFIIIIKQYIDSKNDFS